jgi:hypothetical protein
MASTLGYSRNFLHKVGKIKTGRCIGGRLGGGVVDVVDWLTEKLAGVVGIDIGLWGGCIAPDGGIWPCGTEIGPLVGQPQLLELAGGEGAG